MAGSFVWKEDSREGEVARELLFLKSKFSLHRGMTAQSNLFIPYWEDEARHLKMDEEKTNALYSLWGDYCRKNIPDKKWGSYRYSICFRCGNPTRDHLRIVDACAGNHYCYNFPAKNFSELLADRSRILETFKGGKDEEKVQRLKISEDDSCGSFLLKALNTLPLCRQSQMWEVIKTIRKERIGV